MKRLFLLTLLFLWIISGYSQPLYTPLVQKKRGAPEAGYYLLVPYKMRKGAIQPHFQLSILNHNGEVVFFRNVKHASDFKQHPNGFFSYFSQDKFFILNSQLQLIDSVACALGRETDSHDFLILPNGHYVLMGMKTVMRDWSNKYLFAYKNQPAQAPTKVRYGVIQELDSLKNLVYEWSTENDFEPEMADPFYLKDTQHIDLTHFNSVDVDGEGNLLISARYYNEVFKVRRSDGKIIWHLGGRYNNVKLANNNLPFYGQHDAHFISKNTFTLFDNGYTTDTLRHTVRALCIEVNDSSKTGRITWQYQPQERLVSEANGSMQLISDKLLLVNYGKIEFGKPNVTFEIIHRKNYQPILRASFPDTIGSYRSFYYPKLDVSWPLLSPTKKKVNRKIVLKAPSNYKNYVWNTGETSKEIIITKSGEYWLYVSSDGESYYRSKSIRVKVRN